MGFQELQKFSSSGTYLTLLKKIAAKIIKLNKDKGISKLLNSIIVFCINFFKYQIILELKPKKI